MSTITDRQVCEAYAECRRNNRNADGSMRYPYHVLMEVTGATEDECLAAMERAYDEDLIEVGTSLRTGWLTEKGQALLANPYVVTPPAAEERRLGYWCNGASRWDDKAEVTMHEEGITISVTEEKALDSYNSMFTCEAEIPIEQAAELVRALLKPPPIAAALKSGDESRDTNAKRPDPA